MLRLPFEPVPRPLFAAALHLQNLARGSNSRNQLRELIDRFAPAVQQNDDTQIERSKKGNTQPLELFTAWPTP